MSPLPRRVFWTFAKQAQLAHVGEVTVVVSRRRHNDSPKHPKRLVTNCPPATAHLTVALYLRRWPVELCIKELQSVVGLGHPQVTNAAARVERSVAVAGMAYLLLLRLRAKQIKPGSSWSAFTLKQELAWDGAHTNCTARSGKKPERRFVGNEPLNRPHCGWLHKSIIQPVNFEYL